MTNFSINTSRLILRNLETTDLESVCELSLDSEVTKYLTYIKKETRSDVQIWLEDKIKHNNENPRNSYNLAIVEKESNNVVGWIGIGKPTDKTKCDLDFGYALIKTYWGKGYATKALNAIIDYCFTNLEIKKICGDSDIRNEASRKVMEKVGMKFEKTFTEDGKTECLYCISKTI